jgi:predicted dehydrogenase
MGDWGVGWEEGPFDVEDFAMGMIRFENGETLFAEVSWAINSKQVTYSYVCGTEGGASLHPDIDAFKTDGTPIKMDPLPDEDPPTRFISDLLADRPPLGPVEDGVVVMKMLEGILRSAERGEDVRIE